MQLGRGTVWGAGRGGMAQPLLQKGQALVLRTRLPQAIGGQASRSLMDCFADILFALNKHCFSLLSMWIKEALQPPGFPSARLSPEQKDTFSQQILR